MIVPVTAVPPVTPLTCQETALFEEPLTVAVKDAAEPLRTLAEPGATVTVTAEGEEFPLEFDVELEVELLELEPLFDWPLVAPVQPICRAMATKRKA